MLVRWMIKILETLVLSLDSNSAFVLQLSEHFITKSKQLWQKEMEAKPRAEFYPLLKEVKERMQGEHRAQSSPKILRSNHVTDLRI